VHWSFQYEKCIYFIVLLQANTFHQSFYFLRAALNFAEREDGFCAISSSVGTATRGVKISIAPRFF